MSEGQLWRRRDLSRGVFLHRKYLYDWRVRVGFLARTPTTIGIPGTASTLPPSSSRGDHMFAGAVELPPDLKSQVEACSTCMQVVPNVSADTVCSQSGSSTPEEKESSPREEGVQSTEEEESRSPPLRSPRRRWRILEKEDS